MHSRFKLVFFLFAILSTLVQCDKKQFVQINEENGGLFLPDNFEAVVVVDELEGKARHITVDQSGAVYVNLRYSKPGASIAILRDTTGNGQADIIEKYGGTQPGTSGSKGSYATAMRIHNGFVYYSSELEVYRYKLDENGHIIGGEPEIIMVDDHEGGRHQHIGKPIAFDNKGNMYVAFGGPSNACQEKERRPNSPGIDPCPQLENHGGIWKFDANKTNQTQKDGTRFATGIRSVVALDWNPVDENLYAVVHGRDDLYRLWPDLFTPWESALLPSEEFIKITEGSDFGWPYCYYDQLQAKKVLAPEYGGDGKIVGRCKECDDPILGFPGHWAPNELVFYRGEQFPDRYKDGAFIAFHGSTNRAPYPQSGFFIAFVPFENGEPKGDWEIFADGFAKVNPIASVYDAVHRPMGIGVGPEGELYLSDTEKGKVWKVVFTGDKTNFGEKDLALMEKRKLLAHIRTPHEKNDNLMKNKDLSEGHKLYYRYCSACHQEDGNGAGGRFPPLAKTDWVLGDKNRLIKVVLEGLEGAIEINGESFSGLMPQHSFLSDAEIAKILTYIRSNFGNKASKVKASQVNKVRQSLE